MIGKRFFFYLVCMLVLSVGLTGMAAGEDEAVKDLTAYSCKDVMRLSGTDRDVAIGVLHAYLLGKKGATTYNVEKLAEATDRFIDHCLDNPNDKALATMGRLTQ